MIIECSHCTTRFSIETPNNFLSSSSQHKLRFHCCRCGNYFSKNLNTSQATEAATQVNALTQAATKVEAEQVADKKELPAETTETEAAKPLVQPSTPPKATAEEIPSLLAEPTPRKPVHAFSRPAKTALEQQSSKQQLSFLPNASLEELLGAPSPGHNRPPALDKARARHSSSVRSWEEERFKGVTASWGGETKTPHSADMSGLLRQKLGEATEFEGLRGLRKRMQERYLEEKRDTEQAKPLLPKKAATEKPLPKEKPAPEPIGAAPQLKTVRKRVELDERNISDLKQQRKPSIKRNKLRELTQVSSNLSKQVKEVHSKAMYSKLLEFKQLKQHVRPASVFCSVPLSVLLLLWLGAGSASHPQNGFGMALGAIYSQPLQAAPKAVQVEEVEAKAVSLDDGSSVILVTGSINNRSKETLRNIQLSVSLYDQNNELISRKTILHEHALLGAHRIESLSAQMIDDLQSRPRATLKPLKPETKAAFKAIFTSVDNEIRWASARIHGTHFLN